jgi:hypothetical protein
LFFDTEKRQYLNSKVNNLFSLKLDFIRTSGNIKEKLPIKNDEESSLVVEAGLFHDPFLGCSPRKNPCSRLIYC